jgi:hypothetical protein
MDVGVIRLHASDNGENAVHEPNEPRGKVSLFCSHATEHGSTTLQLIAMQPGGPCHNAMDRESQGIYLVNPLIDEDAVGRYTIFSG